MLFFDSDISLIQDPRSPRLSKHFCFGAFQYNINKSKNNLLDNQVVAFYFKNKSSSFNKAFYLIIYRDGYSNHPLLFFI